MSMNKPTVSIVVPAYNVAEKIISLLDEIKQQTLEDWELILVDDGSTDGTLEVLEQYRSDARVSIIAQANRGASAARNAGLRMAQGEYLMFFDSDDDVATDILEKMVSAAKKNPGALVVCGKQVGKKKLMPSKSGLVDGNIKEHVATSVLKNGLLYSPCNKIYRTRTIQRNNITFPDSVVYGEDLIFNLAYLEHMDSIYYIKQALYKYNLSGGGASAKSKGVSEYRAKMLAALRRYIGNDMNVKIAATIQLIKTRWKLAVGKAHLFGRKRG